MKRVKEYLGMNMAFSATALTEAFVKFNDEFKFTPKYLHIEVSIEDIFNGMQLINSWAKEQRRGNWWISCNRHFKEGYWQLSGGKDGTIYSIYSEKEH